MIRLKFLYIYVMFILHNFIRACKKDLLTYYHLRGIATGECRNVICPLITTNCCSELDQMKVHKYFETVYVKDINTYHDNAQKAYEGLADVFKKSEFNFSKPYEAYKTMFEVAPETDKALQELVKTLKVVETDELEKLFKNSIEESKKTSKHIKNLRTGFLCSMCDAEAHKYIDYDSGAVTYSREFCEQLGPKGKHVMSFLDIKYGKFINHIIALDDFYYLLTGQKTITHKRYNKETKASIASVAKCKAGGDSKACDDYCKEFKLNTFSEVFDGDIQPFLEFKDNFTNVMKVLADDKNYNKTFTIDQMRGKKKVEKIIEKVVAQKAILNATNATNATNTTNVTVTARVNTTNATANVTTNPLESFMYDPSKIKNYNATLLSGFKANFTAAETLLKKINFTNTDPNYIKKTVNDLEAFTVSFNTALTQHNDPNSKDKIMQMINFMNRVSEKLSPKPATTTPTSTPKPTRLKRNLQVLRSLLIPHQSNKSKTHHQFFERRLSERYRSYNRNYFRKLQANGTNNNSATNTNSGASGTNTSTNQSTQTNKSASSKDEKNKESEFGPQHEQLKQSVDNPNQAPNIKKTAYNNFVGVKNVIKLAEKETMFKNVKKTSDDDTQIKLYKTASKPRAMSKLKVVVDDKGLNLYDYYKKNDFTLNKAQLIELLYYKPKAKDILPGLNLNPAVVEILKKAGPKEVSAFVNDFKLFYKNYVSQDKFTKIEKKEKNIEKKEKKMEIKASGMAASDSIISFVASLLLISIISILN